VALLDELRSKIEIDLNEQKQQKLAGVMQTKAILSEQTRQLEQILLSVRRTHACTRACVHY